MSFVKNKLKAARDFLGKKDYAGAKDAASQILEYEPDNYNASVFLGLALLELGEHDKSEKAYRRAIEINSEQLLAWQGIAQFYDRTKAWDKYADTLRQLMDLFSRLNDSTKCAETLSKFIEIQRERGTRKQVVEALSLMLLQSPLYPVLSTLPPADPTSPKATSIFNIQVAIHNTLPVLEEIVQLLETDEDERMKKEFDKRRMRLGAPKPEILKKEVQQEMLGESQLPRFYDEILNHPNTPDDLRRLTDSKLLRHKQQYLYSLPLKGDLAATKAKVASEVDSLVNGAVILQIPDELAWMLFIDGRDTDSVEGYDFTSLRQFMALFPSLPLTSLLKGYFTYMSIPLYVGEKEDGDTGQENAPEEPDTGFDMILESHPSVSESIIANRILADVYLLEMDYGNAITVAENGLEFLRRFEANNGKTLHNVRIGFKVIVATSLVHLFPPKHHARAIPLLDEILSKSPDNIACLMGRAYILQEAKKWVEAEEVFARVSDLLPEDMDAGLRAKEERGWCLCNSEDAERGLAELREVLGTLQELEDRDIDSARCLWRLGKCQWDMGDEHRKEAYRYFITSLKKDPSYAPAFASLGIYYSEYLSPADPVRASKCFQKAFELDPREADAARRLALGFAEEQEWNLVEVVSRRTIEGEGGLDAGMKGTEHSNVARYLPMNAWAWKAVGVVELNRHNYAPAIQAFQIALRAEPECSQTWVRLGEAYGKAGRHVAALKALEHAQTLVPDDWMCAYFIGEVRREVGQFLEAIAAFDTILVQRPTEIGVLVSLGQTYLDLGRSELADGYIARAEQSFVTSIRMALATIKNSSGFRNVVWKTAADALFFLSTRSTFMEEDKVRGVLAESIELLAGELSGRLSGLISLPTVHEYEPLVATTVLEIAMVAYDHRVSLGSSESMARGSAWFDLGMTLRSWASKATSTEKQQLAEKKSIECLTQALRDHPENDSYWSALGDANFLANAKTAQHAYIRAMEIDSKNVVTWTNLGFLYLHHNDVILANEALFRAQTVDPDYTLAWIGQALVATANGHDQDAQLLFGHAVSLSAVVPEADFKYAVRAFSQANSYQSPAAAMDTLLPAFFVLERYCKQRPDDSSALHLYGLICERLHLEETAVDLISRAISILETAYEETEDAEIERHFTIAHSNMARLRLSRQEYDSAIESYESALGLIPENDDPTSTTLRAHAQFGLGLATFKMGDAEAALDHFEAALETAGDNVVLRGHITVLLAQTMWAIGSEDFKETAKAKLLECIESDPENLTAINTLAAMGILTDDDNLVDAALSEILALPLEQRLELDPKRDVGYLLTQHYIGQNNTTKALSVAQSAVFAEPAQAEVRNDLAALCLRNGEHDAVLPILSSSSTSDGSHEVDVIRASASVRAVAKAIQPEHPEDGLRLAQKGIMLTPWDSKNWLTLAYVRSQIASG